MTDTIRRLLRRPGFWWTLVGVNVALVTAQPVVLLLSVAAVLALHALVAVAAAVPPDWGLRVGLFTVRLMVWGVIGTLATAGVAFVWLSAGGRIGREDDFALVGGGAGVTLGLYLLRRWWRWWRRTRPPAAPDRRVVATVARDPVRVEADPLAGERRAAELAAQQKRREDARARVELFFNVNAPELAARFTRDMLADYLTRYMGDERPAEVVEERGETLLGVIRQHLDKAVPKPSAQSLDDVLATFQARMRKIRESALDDDDKQHLLIQLEEQREAAVARAIREGWA